MTIWTFYSDGRDVGVETTGGFIARFTSRLFDIGNYQGPIFCKKVEKTYEDWEEFKERLKSYGLESVHLLEGHRPNFLRGSNDVSWEDDKSRSKTKLLPTRIFHMCDPYQTDVWGNERISMEGVLLSMLEGKTLTEQYCGQDSWCKEDHEARVAFMVTNLQSEPIEIHLFSLEEETLAMVYDGHHRLAAALYKGDDLIECSFPSEHESIFDEIAFDGHSPVESKENYLDLVI